ncbi:HAD-IIA family hydrolase [Nocardia mexicana]|uniref:HAD superfamily hydrolase (TIGR01458 family) n=1 Tax=Nocardia mexicana TaxID=279262 RepID=A0A370H848_9NOCA|nr:HAD-IIA family hydrolase [Nocardia mexicana]RDI52145.1 HAD superfamily hydrolase (TIGR01458 family) [Nocardia mexicana]
MSGIQGVLYDIDGVLVTSWRALPGAAEAVRCLREAGLRRAFLTNTTSATCAEISERLCAAGISVDRSEIVTAARLTVEYLHRHHPDARVWVLNHGDIDEDLGGLTLDAEHPDVIVIGGAGAEFTHRALSAVVEAMLDGVPVIAMQGGMTWATDDGLRIDTGAYLPGLEAAGRSRITVIGKPSATGFHACAELLGLRPEQLLMIGDDLHSDVLAAQQAGMTGALVRTGKFRQAVLDDAPGKPNHVLDSVADLPALLHVEFSK